MEIYVCMFVLRECVALPTFTRYTEVQIEFLIHTNNRHQLVFEV